MYSRSKALQQYRRERRERQRREQVQLNPLVSKCLRVMGMSRFAMSFENMSFPQFIRMPLDQYRVYGDEFVSLYAELLDRIEALCASAFSMLDDLRPTGTLRLDEPKQKTLSVRPTCPTWADSSPDLFADSDPPMQHTDVIHTWNSDITPKIRCRDLVDVSLHENGQLFKVCAHQVGECDRYQT